MLLQRCTHSICRVHFNSSVTPSVAFICSMIVSNRFCACSFRSARYVNNSPVSINVLNLAGLSEARRQVIRLATYTPSLHSLSSFRLGL